MTPRTPACVSMVDWGLALIMGNALPPRDPNEDDDDEDGNEPDDEGEPAVIREPDEAD